MNYRKGCISGITGYWCVDGSCKRNGLQVRASLGSAKNKKTRTTNLPIETGTATACFFLLNN